LKVNTPGDEYEQEADRVANQVMRMPESAVQRRTCSCGKPAGPDGMCADCKRKQLNIQRKASGESGQMVAPPIVHHTLQQPGRPLDAPTRSFMEARFGQDFGRVRVHTDTLAANSADSVSARAYTVGYNIIFGGGQYAPDTHSGRHLMAHELAHVVQQQPETPSDFGVPKHYATERLARWSIDANTATVDSEEDRLGQLPGKVNSSALNWVCIRPLSMRTASNPTIPADFEDHYEKYLQRGDTFDLSNLKTTYTGTSLKLSLFDKTENNHIVVSTLYPGIKVSKDPDADIGNAAQEGKTPIADFLIGGHQAGGAMYGTSGRLEPSVLSSDEPAPTFTRAKDSKFPRRCWFTHFGTARSVGCASDAFGKSFASVYLRKGAGIDTTLRLIAPACTSTHRKPDGTCDSIDAIEFRPSADEEKTPEHGPFKLSETGNFHGSPFWSRIGGTL
jgi:hypothetical protein